MSGELLRAACGKYRTQLAKPANLPKGSATSEQTSGALQTFSRDINDCVRKHWVLELQSGPVSRLGDFATAQRCGQS